MEITKEYILSEDYVRDMMTGYDGYYDEFLLDLYDAEPKTLNYNIRHFELTTKLGGWRWKGIFTYRQTFADLIFNNTLNGVDFGGSQRPISNKIDIVDIEKKDYYGRAVKYNSLSDLDKRIDFIFSSHTLEHVLELETVLEDMYNVLDKDGILALNLPSYTCRRWRANTGNWMGGTPHKHTFKLGRTRINETLPALVNIDQLVKEKGFTPVLSEYTGDNSIIIFAEK